MRAPCRACGWGEVRGALTLAPPGDVLREAWAPQAQGLWRMLQGKPADEAEERRQRAERERQENLKTDDEWGTGGASGEAVALLRKGACQHQCQQDQTLSPS